MKQIAEPSGAIIMAVVQRSGRIRNPYSWQQARQAAINYMSSVANDNRSPFLRKLFQRPNRIKTVLFVLWTPLGLLRMSRKMLWTCTRKDK